MPLQCRSLLLINNLIKTFSKRSLSFTQSKIPRLILFDIDGTLIYGQHKSDNVPIVQAVAKAFNTEINRNGVMFSGKTDQGIIRELLAANNVKYDQQKVNEVLKIYPDIFQNGVDAKEDIYTALPNALRILEQLSTRKDVICGLLTGNIMDTAGIKLKNANESFLKYFVKTSEGEYVGAFGSDKESRNDLIPFAMQRYAQYLKVNIDEFNPNNFIVIGDTPRDIECAHAHNVAAIGIATGHYTIKQLQDANADAVISDFSDIPDTIDLLTTTNYTQTKLHNN